MQMRRQASQPAPRAAIGAQNQESPIVFSIKRLFQPAQATSIRATVAVALSACGGLSVAAADVIMARS